MEHHTLTQGSPQWHAYRFGCNNASDAPAMLGVSSYKTRAQLLRELATGLSEEVTPDQQRRFDDGHRAEALARPLAERLLGEELYPVTGSEQFEGLERPLSASFDGLTLLEGDAFEHKALNDRLRAAMPAEGVGDGAALPIEYRAQMEQQLLVSGANRVLFMASKWNQAGELIEARYAEYRSDPELRAQLLAGWAQFEADLAAWKPAEAAPAKPVARTMDNLPALHIQATGAVTASNLAEFKAHALDCIRSINRSLSTDQDFADAEAAIKWCAKVEESMAAAEQALLAQTADVAAAVNTLRELAEEARKVRLPLNRDVTAEKDRLKAERIHAARAALAEHMRTLGASLPAGITLKTPDADFAAAIKGKRTLSSVDDAISTLLANTKASAAVQLANVQANLAQLESLRATASLLPDLSALVQRLPDDFAAIVRGRVAQAQAEQQAREAQRLAREAEAARLAAERERQERARAEQHAAEEAQAAAQAKAQADAAAAIAAAQAQQPAPVVQPARTVDEPATLKLGAIGERLGFSVTADFLASLGFEAVTVKAAKCYRPSDWPRICDALIQHLRDVREPLAVGG